MEKSVISPTISTRSKLMTSHWAHPWPKRSTKLILRGQSYLCRIDMDRCIPNPFAYGNLYIFAKKFSITGVKYLQLTSGIALNSIASKPVWICFCNKNILQISASNFYSKKGETFNVSLVAVDRVNHTVDANISSSLSLFSGGFGEDQQIQVSRRNCTICCLHTNLKL